MITGLETINMSFIAIGTIASESRRIESFRNGISEVAGPDIFGASVPNWSYGGRLGRVWKASSQETGTASWLLTTPYWSDEKRMSPAIDPGSSREQIPPASFPLRVSGKHHVLVIGSRRCMHLGSLIFGRSRSQPNSSGPLLHVF